LSKLGILAQWVEHKGDRPPANARTNLNRVLRAGARGKECRAGFVLMQKSPAPARGA
jgi:hypothetical protein